MAEIEATKWLPAIGKDWNDPDTRRARFQDVMGVEIVRMLDPERATHHEQLLTGDSNTQRDAARRAVFIDVLHIVNGQRLAYVNDHGVPIPLRMHRFDTAEGLMMRELLPQQAIDTANEFLRRLQVQPSA